MKAINNSRIRVASRRVAEAEPSSAIQAIRVDHYNAAVKAVCWLNERESTLESINYRKKRLFVLLFLCKIKQNTSNNILYGKSLYVFLSTCTIMNIVNAANVSPATQPHAL
jgi:hypothetical protein